MLDEPFQDVLRLESYTEYCSLTTLHKLPEYTDAHSP